MANTYWFSAFYSDIEYIFDYLPGTSEERYFKISLPKYAGELIYYINNKLDSEKINYTKSEILSEVTKFVNRKVSYKKYSIPKYFS